MREEIKVIEGERESKVESEGCSDSGGKGEITEKGGGVAGVGGGRK